MKNVKISELESPVYHKYTGYEVTPEGKIISYKKSKKGKELKQTMRSMLFFEKFPCVGLNHKGKTSYFMVKDIVAEAFLLDSRPDIKNSIIWHADGDYTNCHVDNLVWYDFFDLPQIFDGEDDFLKEMNEAQEEGLI